MADRVLTWHIPGVLTETGVLGVNTDIEYVADKDYRPVLLRVQLKTAPVSGLLTLDVNDDGSSLLVVPATLSALMSAYVWDYFVDDPTIYEDSVITLDLDAIPVGAADLTVHLELEAV